MTEKMTVGHGTQIFDCFRFGRGKRTLVILPGVAVQSVIGAADAVAEAYRPLADDFTVYLFDRRRDLPPGSTLSDLARDAACAIESAGLDRVSLFGASQGGMMAVKIAADRPELVEKLAVASSAVRVTEDCFLNFERWIAAAQSSPEDLYLAFAEDVYPREIFERSRGLLKKAAGSVTEEDLERFIIQVKAMRDADISGDLERISCPMLSVYDNDDCVFGAEAVCEIGKYMKDRPGFEQYVYEGYGHAVYDTAPDFKERMLEFLLR